MPEILKTKAVVLSKMNFGDSSKIAHLYTENSGKKTVIIKGARSPKSKIGRIIDPLNFVEIVFYNKVERDMQLISSADLLNYYPKTKEDLNKLTYASAVCECVLKLTHENEKDSRLFNGIVRILDLINKETNENEKLLFVKFLLFLIKELGYELTFNKCGISGQQLSYDENICFNYEKGFFKEKYKTGYEVFFEFRPELFKLFLGLNSKTDSLLYSAKQLDLIIAFLEKYLKYHTPDFKGIHSLNYYV